MQEWLMIAAMGTGSISFAIGGTGFKFVRRFIMPIVLAIICFYAQFDVWRCAAFAVSASIVLHLGYGEKTPYWQKFFVFCGYAACTLFLGLSVWQIVTPFFIFGIFTLSNWEKTAEVFPWKICEFLMGSMIGIEVADLIGKKMV